MLTCDSFIDRHGLKPKLTLIFHGFRDRSFAGCVKYEKGNLKTDKS
jgi:hypothetical protein